MAKRTFHTDRSDRAVVLFAGYSYECNKGDIVTEDSGFAASLSINPNFNEVVAEKDEE